MQNKLPYWQILNIILKKAYICNLQLNSDQITNLVAKTYHFKQNYTKISYRLRCSALIAYIVECLHCMYEVLQYSTKISTHLLLMYLHRQNFSCIEYFSSAFFWKNLAFVMFNMNMQKSNGLSMCFWAKLKRLTDENNGHDFWTKRWSFEALEKAWLQFWTLNTTQKLVESRSRRLQAVTGFPTIYWLVLINFWWVPIFFYAFSRYFYRFPEFLWPIVLISNRKIPIN